MNELQLFMQRNLDRADFLRLVANHDGFGVGQDLLALFPEGTLTRAEFMFQALEVLRKQGLLEQPELFVALAAEMPRRKAEIMALAARNGVDAGALKLGLARVATSGAATLLRGTPLLIKIGVVMLALNVAISAIDCIQGMVGRCDDSPAPAHTPIEQPLAPDEAPLLAAAPEEELFMLDDDDTIILDEVTAEPPRTARRSRTRPGRVPAANPIVEPVPAEPTREGGRCETDVRDRMTAMFPDYRAQRAAIDDPTAEIRLFVGLAADGRTTRVVSDKVWGVLNSGVVESIKDATFAADDHSSTCVCEIDFTADRVICKDHSAR